MRLRPARLLRRLRERLLEHPPGPPRPVEAPTAPAGPPPAGAPAPSRPAPHTEPLRGEDTVLVRPYLVAHEREQEARRQRARRQELWLALYGVEFGPRMIHGVEVTA